MIRKKQFAALGAAVVAAAAVPIVVITSAASAASTVQWKPCATPEEDFGLALLECTTLAVPMDYGKPDGEKITVVFSRLATSDNAHRRGVLFTNPGGPGGAGLAMPMMYAEQPIANVYDIIGMDPRGVGRSTPLDCVLPGDANEQKPAVETRPTDAEFPLVAKQAQALEDACAKSGGDYRRHVTTANTARDMDSFRAALGEEKINYLGVSYGTWLGAVYGEMFPERLDRSVLDSSMHPANNLQQQNSESARAVKGNFDAWAKWTADRDKTFHLGSNPWAVRATIDRVAAAIGKKPTAGFANLTAFDNAVGESTRYRLMWAPFAKNIGKTLAEITGAKPDPALATSNQRATEATNKMSAEDTKVNGIYPTVTCEWAWSTDLNSYYRDMRWVRDTFPYGDTVAMVSPTTCAFQQTPHEPQIEIGPRRYPAGLVLAADSDTQTVYSSGQAMARTLENSLITVRDNGAHGQYAMGPAGPDDLVKTNKCVNDKVNAYLVDGTVPPLRVSCDTANPPAAIPADPHGIDVGGLIPDLGAIAQAILDSILTPRPR